MKKLFTILIASVAMVLISCNDDEFAARTPVASVTVNETALEINQSMIIHFTGVADQVVIYTGDEGHDYALREQSNTGFVVNKGLFSYSYPVPGTFHVVCIATTYDTFLGSNLQTDTYEFDVTVSDDVTEIRQLYSSITPNVYYATLVDDVNWVLRLPTKQVYNNKELNLNATRQRLTFDIASDSTKVFIDDEPFATKNYYNLTLSHAIRVEAYSGSVRNYMLHTLFYPEFSSISIGEAKGALSRNAYYQDLLTYTFELPEGVDRHAAPLTFTLPDNTSLMANGKKLSSGDKVDLDAKDTYTLLLTSSENNLITATSRLVFNVKE